MFFLISAHIDRILTFQRSEDGFFHCLCGEFSVRNPDQLRIHLNPSCITDREHKPSHGSGERNSVEADTHMEWNHHQAPEVALNDVDVPADVDEGQLEGFDRIPWQNSIETDAYMHSNDHQAYEAILDHVDVPVGVDEEGVGKLLSCSIFINQS
jgi:hypothetical protein